ncbi:MAG: hypothetical protein KIT84_11200 [Labilithrix sp.]|nr:hypothetical protein [Labilithrix sp.]MCW5811575.1 hypothetical protein [Labilithrix sp.]
MDLFKSAIATLVMLGGCERSSPPRSEAVAATSETVVKPTQSLAAASPSAATPAAATSETVVKPTKSLAAARPSAATPAPSAKTVYVCPMHPDVTSDAPGLCPKCNMKLEPKTKSVQVAPLEDASRRL